MVFHGHGNVSFCRNILNKELGAALDIADVTNEFVDPNDNRLKNFGAFRKSDFVTVSK